MRGTAKRWWPAIPGVIVGYLIGWYCAYPLTVGGFASLGAPILVLMAAALLGIIALIAWALARWTKTQAAGRALLRGTGVAAATAAVAFVLVPVLSLGYHEPVTIRSEGTMSLEPAGLGDAGEGGSGGATCDSVPDTRELGAAFGMDLGTIWAGGIEGTLRGGVQRMDTTADWTLELLIDGGDLFDDDGASKGVGQPFWQGPVTVDLADDGLSGTAEFGPVDGAMDPWPNGWSGTLTWECGEF